MMHGGDYFVREITEVEGNSLVQLKPSVEVVLPHYH